MLGTFVLSLVGCLYFNSISTQQEMNKFKLITSTIIQILLIWAFMYVCLLSATN